jgi:hypothetical protein
MAWEKEARFLEIAAPYRVLFVRGIESGGYIEPTNYRPVLTKYSLCLILL